MKTGRSAVFLDRDGVLNRLVERDGGWFSPRRIEDFELFPWTTDSLIKLKSAGFCLIVVTNQPDIARGYMSMNDLDLMHSHLQTMAPVDAILVCPHDTPDACPCRKPRIGLFTRGIEMFSITPETSWTIGDRESDVIAGHAAGTQVIHILSGQDQERIGDETVSLMNLREAADFILNSSDGERSK